MMLKYRIPWSPSWNPKILKNSGKLPWKLFFEILIDFKHIHKVDGKKKNLREIKRKKIMSCE